MSQLTVIQGDITQLKVDAIVNSASRNLLAGGEVDRAIQKAAGIELIEACKKLKGCDTGYAKLTPGFLLPAKNIIHTVAPSWHGGTHSETELLAQCYFSSLKLAIAKNCQTIVFPPIGCGRHKFPAAIAAEVAINTCSIFLETNTMIKQVTFCCLLETELTAYQNALSQLGCAY